MDNRNLRLFAVLIILIGLMIFINYFGITGYVINTNRNLVISLEIPPEQQKIIPGQNILLEVVIREPGGTLEETTIIDLEYLIKDFEGNVVSAKKERGVISVKRSEVADLLIPTNTEPGVYLASVNVKYNGEQYTATKTFEVVDYDALADTKANLSLMVLIFIISVVITIFIIILVAVFNRKKIISWKKLRKHKKR